MLDLAIIQAAQTGDQVAWESLVIQSMPALRAWSLRYTSASSQAEDVIQEALLEAYRMLGTLREPAAWWQWLRLIVFKHADRLRRRSEVVSLPLEVGATIEDTWQTEGYVLAHEVTQSLHMALAKLSVEQQTVVQFFYGHGYTYSEIAEHLDLPVNTVRKRLYHARQNLRKYTDSTLTEYRDTCVPLTTSVRFMLAVYAGHLPRVQELLQRDPQLSHVLIEHSWSDLEQLYRPNAQGETPLHLAARVGHREIGQILINSGADVNASTRIGLTPLHTSVLYNQPLITRLLLQNSANINAQLNNGMTPLHWAVIRKRTEIMALLEQHDADWYIQDCGGRTPQDWLEDRSGGIV